MKNLRICFFEFVKLYEFEAECFRTSKGKYIAKSDRKIIKFRASNLKSAIKHIARKTGTEVICVCSFWNIKQLK